MELPALSVTVAFIFITPSVANDVNASMGADNTFTVACPAVTSAVLIVYAPPILVHPLGSILATIWIVPPVKVPSVVTNETTKSTLVFVSLYLSATTLPPFEDIVMSVASSTGKTPSTKISTTSSARFFPGGIVLPAATIALPATSLTVPLLMAIELTFNEALKSFKRIV